VQHQVAKGKIERVKMQSSGFKEKFCKISWVRQSPMCGLL
jgi:hypothetical protein